MARRQGKSAGKSKASKSKVTVDLSNVETVSKVPDGDYAVKVKGVTLETSEEKGTQYLRFALTITEGKHAGKSLRHQNSLQPNALFALRNTLEALNYPIPDGAFDLDLPAMEGLEMAVAVENEEYNGKDRSQVVEVFSMEDLESDEDEDELEDEIEEDEDDSDEDDSDDSDDDSDDDDDDDSDDDDSDEDDSDDDDDDEFEDYTEEELKAMDDEELLEAAEEYDVTPKYKGKGSKKALNKAATIKLILEAIEEDDEEDED